MDDTALPLTRDMVTVLAIAGFTMVMFLFERIRADVVALVVLVLLGLTGLVEPEALFGGFSGNAVISIMATMVLGAGYSGVRSYSRSQTPWPSFRPRFSKCVSGRQSGRGTWPRGPARLTRPGVASSTSHMCSA